MLAAERQDDEPRAFRYFAGWGQVADGDPGSPAKATATPSTNRRARTANSVLRICAATLSVCVKAAGSFSHVYRRKKLFRSARQGSV